MSIRFDVIHRRDRRTDKQTDGADGRTLHDSIDRACIAKTSADSYGTWTPDAVNLLRM